MSDHTSTPGPWVVEQVDDGLFQIDHVDGEDEACPGCAGTLAETYCRGNADLIAAVPDLIDALKRARETIILLTKGSHSVLGTVNAALIKAGAWEKGR